jgi:hypothetical protein
MRKLRVLVDSILGELDGGLLRRRRPIVDSAGTSAT